jgi:hypothetical protein
MQFDNSASHKLYTGERMRLSLWMKLGLLLTCTTIITNAQLYEYNQLIPQFYNFTGNTFWASGGAGVADKNDESAAIHNPASVSADKISITLEGGYKFKSDYGFYTCNDIAVFPSCIAAAIPLGQITLMGGYEQTYTQRLNSMSRNFSLEIDLSEGYLDLTVHTVYAGVKWQALENFSIGVTALDNIANEEATSSYYSNNYSGNKFGLIAGLQYDPLEWLNVGASLQTESKITLDDASTFYQGAIAGIPLRAEFGAAFKLSDAIRLLGSMEYQKWSDVYDGSAEENKWQFHTGIIATPINGFEAKIGFFTATGAFNDDNYHQFFLTAGFSAQINDHVAFTATYITSQPFHTIHWYNSILTFDDNRFYQNILSAGVRAML